MARIPAADSLYHPSRPAVKKFLRTKDVAERYCCCHATIHTLVKAGRLKAFRLTPTGPLLFDPDKLPDLLSEAAS
jgi:hypothetical protein